MNSHRLRVTEKSEETTHAVTIVLELPSSLRQAFHYLPGQFLTLQFEIDGEMVRRAYSISGCPVEDDHLQFTVKRVSGGLVSNHIVDHLQVGDTVLVGPANGKFFTRTDPQHYKTYYLFGAGSGITPLISILRSVLAAEPHSHVFLLFGNRSEEEIIFRSLLTALVRQYGDRLRVVHTVSRPKRERWSAVWSWDGVDWHVRKGRIDEQAIRWFFAENPPVAQDATYWICGPGSMIETVTVALKSIGVPEQRIHAERFATNSRRETDVAVDIVPEARLMARIDGELISVTVNDNATLLRCLLSHGVDAPYSCESGVCGTCKAKLKAGTVRMDSIAGLETSEVDDGYILACQARPTSNTVELEF